MSAFADKRISVARPPRMTSLDHALAFCARFGLQFPILLAPMAGVPAPSLSIAVAQAGGMAACGALMLQPNQIVAWADEVRTACNGAFQINLWVPDPPARRDDVHETTVREFLSQWGPKVPPEAGNAALPDFAAQCDALLRARPRAASSVMGLFPAAFAARLKTLKIAWFATVTSVTEARAAEAAGADVIVAQGMEAGGHRGCFEAVQAERQQVGLLALLPAVVDAVSTPVVAAGGITDARGVAAALVLGASAVQIGTGFLRSPEAGMHPAWADALASTAPEDTTVTRAFSGRAARSITTDFVRAAFAAGEFALTPYPVQRGLTSAMRAAARQTGDLQRMQAWAGQSAALARAQPAAQIVRELWDGARQLLA